MGTLFESAFVQERLASDVDSAEHWWTLDNPTQDGAQGEDSFGAVRAHLAPVMSRQPVDVAAPVSFSPPARPGSR